MFKIHHTWNVFLVLEHVNEYYTFDVTMTGGFIRSRIGFIKSPTSTDERTSRSYWYLIFMRCLISDVQTP